MKKHDGDGGIGDLFGGSEAWRARREALHNQYKMHDRLDSLRETAMGVLSELEHEGPREEKKEELTEEEMKVLGGVGVGDFRGSMMGRCCSCEHIMLPKFALTWFSTPTLSYPHFYSQNITLSVLA